MLLYFCTDHAVLPFILFGIHRFYPYASWLLYQDLWSNDFASASEKKPLSNMGKFTSGESAKDW